MHFKVQPRRFASMRKRTPVTFGELEARANQLAHFFGKHGLREGDAIAILMENDKRLPPGELRDRGQRVHHPCCHIGTDRSNLRGDPTNFE